MIISIEVRKNAKIRNPYNQIPHLTQDTIWESDENTRKYHKLESQEVSPFPAGDHKAARNRQDSMTRNIHSKNDPQKKHRLGRVSTKFTGVLKMFDITNLILISDVDQDRQIIGSREKSLTYRCIIS